MVRLALAAIVACAVLSTGCATTTKIVSEPPGAEVYDSKAGKDAKPLGKTPMSYEYKGWIWESQQLKVQAPGHKAKTVEIKRNEIDLLPTVGAVCLCLTPLLCTQIGGIALFVAGGMKLPAETKVKLDREAAPAEPAAPPVGLREENGAPVVALRY